MLIVMLKSEVIAMSLGNIEAMYIEVVISRLN